MVQEAECILHCMVNVDWYAELYGLNKMASILQTLFYNDIKSAILNNLCWHGDDQVQFSGTRWDELKSQGSP